MMGWFICRQDYLTIQLLTKHEMTAKIEELKSSHPTTLLTAEDLSAIYEMMNVDVVKGAGESTKYTQILSDCHVLNDTFTLLFVEIGEEINESFALTALLHGLNIDQVEVLRALRIEKRDMQTAFFSDNTRTYICVCHTTLIGTVQYKK